MLVVVDQIENDSINVPRTRALPYRYRATELCRYTVDFRAIEIDLQEAVSR